MERSRLLKFVYFLGWCLIEECEIKARISVWLLALSMELRFKVFAELWH